MTATRPRKMMTLALGAALSVALAAGCGGDDDDADADETTTTEAEETTTTEAETTTTEDGATTTEADDDEVEADEDAADVSWSLNAVEFRDQVGRRIGFDCPSAGSPGTVWGSGTYTDDSSVCTAAVHAGLITVAEGGRVVIEVAAGQDAYAASEANGITTIEYPEWPGSFTFPVTGDDDDAKGDDPIGDDADDDADDDSNLGDPLDDTDD